MSAIAVLVLVVASLWWWREASVGPSNARSLGAEPTQELAASAPTASSRDVIESTSDVRQVAPTVEQLVDRDHDLHGIVLEPNGNPVAGASVEVLRNEFCEILSLDPEHRFDCTSIARASSDARGEFAIALQPGRAFDLAVDAAGFAHASFEHCHAGERVEVRLERGSTLSGRVSLRGDGIPLAGARVELGRGNTNYLRESTPRTKTITDELGRYHLQGIASGTYCVWVFAVEGVPTLETIEIAPVSSVEHDFALDAGRTVSGRVIDAQSGAPIANAQIGTGARFEISVRSNSNGEFTCRGLPEPGALYVRAAGYGRTELDLREHAQMAASEPIEIRMQRGRIVRGRLIDDHGAALAGVYAAAVTYKQGQVSAALDWQATRTTADGRFELDDVRPDMPHVLWLRKDGLATLAYSFPKNETELAAIDFGDIPVAVASTVRGILVDENGQPFSGHVLHLRGWNSDLSAFGGVEASREFDRTWVNVIRLPAQSQALDGFLGDRSTRTDDLGRFSFGDLAAGSYTLATHMPRATHETTLALQVDAGASLGDVTFVFSRGPTLEGRVFGSSGESIYAYLTCQTEGEAPQGNDGSTYTDASGHFKIEGLSPMEYTLWIVPQPRAGEDPSKRKWLRVEMHHIAAGTHDLRVVCRRYGSIAGTVVDSNGARLAHIQVFARSCTDGRIREGAVSDTDGHFELSVADDQRYDIGARTLRPDPSNAGEFIAVPDSEPARSGDVLGVATGGAPIVIRMP